MLLGMPWDSSLGWSCWLGWGERDSGGFSRGFLVLLGCAYCL